MGWDQVHAAIRKFNSSFYKWVDTSDNQPSPGAEAMAFTSLMLPIQVYDGAGENVLAQLRAWPSVPVFQYQMVVPTGIAGIVAGQIAPDALTDHIQATTLSG